MNTENIGAITRKVLVKILHEHGFADVKERTVESWQGKDLLPPFDTKGGGLGKGKGRAEGSWSNGELIMRQAVCVVKLLRVYRSAERAYVPLVMLGYNVPIARLRSALTNPVVDGLNEVLEKAETFGNLEDGLLDSAGEVSDELGRANLPLLSVPFEMLDAIGNIFFNEKYDFTDAPFEAGRKALREWERKLQGAYPTSGDVAAVERSFVLFDRAEFINKYLSVPAIRKALDECTDADLERVGHNLGIIGEIGCHFTEFLLRNMPPEVEMTKEFAYGILFKAGTYLALADLSLRRNGYGTGIDCAGEWLLKSFREEALPAFCPESPTGQLLAAAMVKVFDLVTKLMMTVPPAGGENGAENSQLFLEHIERAMPSGE